MASTQRGPALVTDTAGLAAARVAADGRPGNGHQHRRAVVMTMGALHAGHLSLVRRATQVADQVVVTIFVNPLQFGPTEDLQRYPRDLDGDLALLAGDGLLGPGDLVCAPTPAVMYPDGDPVVRVSAGRIGEVLEGAFRPGHLDGVLTVVLKLMHLTRPDAALFGRKDAQQLAAVRRMVRDLDLPVMVIGMPIVREADGLALSSRNAYLTPDERRRALSLSHALAAARAAAGEGSAPDDIRAAALEVLTGAEGVDSVDYAVLVDPDSFEDVAPAATGPALLALAAHVGATRLIDNVGLTLR
jgi:pantoate--beta-alanine ligase